VLVTVVPYEANGVFPDRLNLGRLCQRLEHRQRTNDRLQRIAWLAAILLALLIAQRAGAGITQEYKRIAAAVTVLPLDVHTGTGGLVDFD